jgi:hypothetical protein
MADLLMKFADRHGLKAEDIASLMVSGLLLLVVVLFLGWRYHDQLLKVLTSGL